jgi:hypothetical protein
VRRSIEIIPKKGAEHNCALVDANVRPELRALAKWLDTGALDVEAKQN